MPTIRACLLVPLLLAAAAPILAWEGSLDLAAQSKYLWRGMVLNDKPVFQPSLNVSHGGLAMSVWFNIDLTDDHGHRFEHNEIDYIAAYTAELEHVDLTVTAYMYTLPHTSAASTTELWGSIAWKTVLRPTLTVVRDVDAVDGTYFLLTASHQLGVLKVAGSDGLVLGLNLGYGSRDYTRGYFPTSDVDHVTDVGARLDWSRPAGPGVLKLNLQYSTFTSAKVRTPGFENDRSNLCGGVAYTLPVKL